MRDLFSTRNQACWTELIEKEAYSRARWRIKFAHKYPRVPGPRKKCQLPFLCPAPDPAPAPGLLPPISPTRMECPEATTSPREGVGIQSSQKEDKKGQAEEAKADPFLPDMRPATPKTGQLLYQGISPGEGVGVHFSQEEDKKGQVEEGKADPFLPDMRPATPKTGQLLYQGISREGKGRLLYLQTRRQQKPEDKFRYLVLSSWDYGWCIGDAMKEAKAPAHARSRLIRDTFYFRSGVFHQPSRADQRL